jgi:MFS family permease
VISKLPWGLLTERIQVRWVLSLCTITAGLSLMIVVVSQDLVMFYVYAVLFGLMMGGYPTIMNVVWPTYFGRQNAGTIRGFVTPVSTIVGTITPVYAGWIWDRYGSYDLAFTHFAISWILAGIVMLAAVQPKPPTNRLD